jgi:hypothetical protein
MSLKTVSVHRISRLTMFVGACGVACSLATAALSEEATQRATLYLTYSLQIVARSTPTSDPTCPIKQLVEGAGETNLLGPVHDVQSDCIQEDGTITQGVFTLTGATLAGGLPGGDDSDDSISGQYKAHLVPTIASVLSNPPAGYWLIYGEVCVSGGTGKFAGVINDCPTSDRPGQYYPARLTVDLTVGQANVFATVPVNSRGEIPIAANDPTVIDPATGMPLQIAAVSIPAGRAAVAIPAHSARPNADALVSTLAGAKPSTSVPPPPSCGLGARCSATHRCCVGLCGTEGKCCDLPYVGQYCTLSVQCCYGSCINHRCG